MPWTDYEPTGEFDTRLQPPEPQEFDERYSDLLCYLEYDISIDSLPLSYSTDTIRKALQDVYGERIQRIRVENEGRKYVTVFFEYMLDNVALPNCDRLWGLGAVKAWMDDSVEDAIQRQVTRKIPYSGAELINWDYNF